MKFNIPDEHKNASGIYVITCNGLRYIGRAMNLERRWKTHRSYVRYPRKGIISYSMYKYFSKRPTKVFFELLELCEPRMLKEREHHYIITVRPELNSFPLKGEKKKKLIVPK